MWKIISWDNDYNFFPEYVVSSPEACFYTARFLQKFTDTLINWACVGSV